MIPESTVQTRSGRGNRFSDMIVLKIKLING